MAALAGCMGGSSQNTNGSGNTNDSGVTTIEYWRWPHSTEPSNKAEREIIKEFNEGPGKKQGIKVTEVTSPYGNYGTKLKTAIGGGAAPALGWGFSLQLFDPTGKSRSKIAKNAPFVMLDDYLTEEYRNQFYDPFFRWQAINFKGPVGVPFIGGLSPGLMYVNVDAWNAAGLGELPSGTWSYEAFHNALKQLQGTNVNGTAIDALGVGLKDASSNAEWDTYTPLSRTHGNIIGTGYKNANNEYVMGVAKDSMAKGWQDYAGTPIHNGWTNNPMSKEFLELQEPFIQGQFALMHHASFTRAQVGPEADFEWDVIPYPTKDGKDFWIYGGGGGANVNFHAFKEEVGGNPDAAWEFIKFRNNAQNQYQWFNTSSQCVPNEKSYQLMKEEGVSDFVKTTRGFKAMTRQDTALNQQSKIRQVRQERYPDMKKRTLNDRTVLSRSMPISVGSGRVHQTMGGTLQRLALTESADPKQQFTEAEKQWAGLIRTAQNLKVSPPSIGYNKPTPKGGPI